MCVGTVTNRNVKKYRLSISITIKESKGFDLALDELLDDGLLVILERLGEGFPGLVPGRHLLRPVQCHVEVGATAVSHKDK